MNNFSVRVYGLLINEQNEVLISDEKEYGMRFSKFPGGGLEFGEGLIAGLQREFIEECNLKIEVLQHYYTTDFFVKSLFHDAQLISVYYTVKNLEPINLTIKQKAFDFDGDVEPLQAFRWVSLNDLTEHDVTFPVDKHVVKLLRQQHGLS
ncbi:NUDIX domain-containing protein [Mucilaginibacter sp. HMF5004]|uniref:NUDIX domain-containing protein n=1 Tax=Mucilaginibacter rivuli TaxID=2857527 RepID=UPI001C5D6ADC|nr:NUDIX domain-containing protein [Mucilaginibacter rivuli]MBW4891347.1 NUDIX domain-containing protein [Mucilaginibacter rivuli]